jgi:hypothetical protein
MDVEGRVAFMPIAGLSVIAGLYSGKRGLKTDGGAATPNTANRVDAAVTYVKSGLRLGAEYFTARNWNNVLTTATDKADGYSLWGSVAIADGVNLFARYDNAKLSKTLDSANKDVYYNAGVEFQVTKGFKLAGVWKHEKADKSVGTPAPLHVQNVKTNEIGVFGEVRF